MRSTMQHVPLSIASVLRHGIEVHGGQQVTTIGEHGLRRTSFGELGGRVSQLANALRRLGIGRDDRVATFQWNNQEHLEAYTAVPAMGAVLHTLNLRLAPEQISYIANHAEDQVVIVDSSVAHLLALALPSMKSVHTVLVAGGGDTSALEGCGKAVLRYDDILASESPEFAWPSIDETAAAAMCYTSGTTGNPKGVVYSHRSLYLHSMAACTGNGLGISANDNVLPIVPMFHANAWGLPYAALMAGAGLLMPDRLLQAEPLVRMIEQHRPTVSGAVPTIWNDILQHLEGDSEHDLSSLRLVACGGSAVPKALIEAFESKYGVPILQAWGMTETSPLASVARPPATVAEDVALSIRSTQGRAICGVQMRLVDAEGHRLPHDGKCVGELEVQGPWIASGYYGETDGSSFRDGWLRTGDVGHIDPQGYLTLTDRAKDVIKSGGEWISSVELENLLASHPDILEAAVIGVADPKWQERPLAAVVLRKGSTVTPEQLRSWMAERIPRWWLPERWCVIEEVPRTSVGKYDKKVLRRRYAEDELEVFRTDG
ncbi:fatty acid--CoA ligase [Saccharopolyspora sp. NPDC049426]|uniref:fatty acid--CoA ligase n=1 Tax=Saccharopolyspora sp. NPDC049426 TaxID=3155652 RepID=UPI0034406FB9